MTSKYPSLAFTTRDVCDLLLELNQYTTGVRTNVELRPTKTDPSRLYVACIGARRSFQIGAPPTILTERYVPGKAQQALEKVIFDLLWEMLQELGAPSSTWGTYTELFPSFPRRKS